MPLAAMLLSACTSSNGIFVTLIDDGLFETGYFTVNDKEYTVTSVRRIYREDNKLSLEEHSLESRDLPNVDLHFKKKILTVKDSNTGDPLVKYNFKIKGRGIILSDKTTLESFTDKHQFMLDSIKYDTTLVHSYRRGVLLGGCIEEEGVDCYSYPLNRIK